VVKEYYTTTEAARLLAVSADTVLKWVRAGKINFYRTPGGHSRIPRAAVDMLLPGWPEQMRESDWKATEIVYQYCWNFYADQGTITEECQNCVAYKSRALRCYEMRDIPEQYGPLKLHCQSNCTECEYYKVVVGSGTSALIVSRSRTLAEELHRHADDAELTLRFASSEYECAALIDKFRPDYVVVDCSFGAPRTRDICQYVTNDDRIPFTRIILTSKTARVKDCCDGEIFGWIKKPFTFEQLKSCLSQVGSVIEK